MSLLLLGDSNVERVWLNVRNNRELLRGAVFVAVKRFDRIDGQRIHYASAMTMLKKESSDDASYLDIAEFIMTRGATGSI